MIDAPSMTVRGPHDLRPPEADFAPHAADECVRCGYSLTGLDDDVACPECGLLAERSRRLDGHLSNALPGWLRGICVGVTLVLAAHVLAAAWLFVAPTIAQGFRPTYSWTGTTLVTGRPPFGVAIDPLVISLVGYLIAAILLSVGLWLLTRPQRRELDDGELRWPLRLASLAPFVAIALALIQRVDALTTWNPATDVFYRVVILAVLTAGCAPIPALMFLLLRRLARRVLHPGLAEHAAIVGFGLSATLVAIPLIALLIMIADRHYGMHWGSRSTAALLLMLVVCVPFVLFAGWSALNCLRFAFAFRRAYRGALRRWRDADRAAATN